MKKFLALGLAFAGMAASYTVSAQTTQLLPLNAVWRYDTNGTELHGTGWEADGFDDSSWAEGRALLAQENNATVNALRGTVLSLFLPESTSVRVTTFWFRVHFNLPLDPVALGAALSLSTSNFIDDGFVMYLNGVELDRFNMSGAIGDPVSANDLAPAANPNGEGVAVVRDHANPPSLRMGDNVLAVEVHQAGNTSSDVVWGSAIYATIAFAPPSCIASPALTNVLEGRNFTLTCASSGSPAPAYQWLKDGLPLADDGVHIVGSTTPTLTISNAVPVLDAGSYVCHVENPLGSCDSPPVTVGVREDEQAPVVTEAIASAASLTTFTVTFDEPIDPASVDNFNIHVVPASGGADLEVQAPTVTGNSITFEVNNPRAVNTSLNLVLNGVLSDLYGNAVADPTTVAILIPIKILSLDDPAFLWRYQTNGVEQTGFQAENFDDSSWAQGAGVFGFPLTDAFAGVVNTPLSLTTEDTVTRVATYYFRGRVNNIVTAANPFIRFAHNIDDGAVFYLNGVEVARYNMPAGPVTYLTQAPVATGDAGAATINSALIANSGIRSGENLLAVEVHQNGTASSDIGFATELYIVATSFTTPPVLTVAQSGANVVVSWSGEGYTLQHADNVTGSWSTATGGTLGGTAPNFTYTVATSAAKKFFRLIK